MPNPHLLLWAGLALMGVFAASQVLRYPGQVFWWVVKSAVLGCLFVFAVNWVGQYVHYHLPFNPLTAMAAGLLGIPGVAALIVLHLWLYA
ncbi:MAG: pro-sigmaK processing inhibitor BofA family protein [Alicyclobacillus macrosporangiidus]|uniref:pro-sigmaK processing inhibitor BofA family protein n=1 Tax=Alicyclobacillus macrosporangiidus TaxID=392015 RepID=UPI0026ECF09D|nr:pro-sigmaK processing inhibitor BofA family protein [Alicyclobacillus macrosporangiidus]MCL6600831.1 pro-sigmaK processing inhibitor BofA family protein [Alicyclobacillus macrosporangiidus]